MNREEQRLQSLLERIEAGESLSELVGEVPQEETALLQLAATLRELGMVERDDALVAAQREQVVQIARQPRVIPVAQGSEPGLNGSGPAASASAWLRPLPTFFRSVISRLQSLLRLWTDRLQSRPLMTLGGAALALLILAILSATVDRNPTGGQIAGRPLPAPNNESTLPDSRFRGDEAIGRYEERRGRDAGIAAAPSHAYYLPALAAPLVSGPGEAVVSKVAGLVEVRSETGEWTTVDHTTRIRAGQRVRTGTLSEAVLSFFDGSIARLGPESELSVDELHANPRGPRRIILTQRLGKSEHEVAQVQAGDRTYRVDTPGGSGEATGTAFLVWVMPGVRSIFGVLHGSIDVTSVNVTVAVIAGQQVIVDEGQPPGDPFFRITGEGEVTALGDTWTIGGQNFAVDDDTVVVGEVAIGDYVLVEGHLDAEGTAIADRIVLLATAPEDRFTLTGEVSAVGPSSWTVAGQTISVNDETRVEPGIAIDDLVRVEGRILEDGALLATHIFLVDTAQPFTFTGVVETIGPEAWVISGVTVDVDDETEIDSGIEVGDRVVASGFRDEDRWVATSIALVEDQANFFSFSGTVDGMAPWSVAGIGFETREWTVIEEGIEVGDRVRVTGRILEDGTWVALSILLMDEDGLTITFVGTVEEIDPWVVNGLSLLVDDGTVLDEEIEVGDLVLVRARRLPEGEWLALLIVRLDDDDEPFLGCFAITAQVIDWDDGQLLLDGWPNLDLGADVNLEELVEGSEALDLGQSESLGAALEDSVVTIYVCVLPNDELVVINIIIIFVVDEEPPPPPPPPVEEDKVTVCHKPGKLDITLTIGRPALGAHLGHGDQLGPCR